MALDWNNYLLPLILFAFTMAGTPGPNNIMLTASGANFGFRRSIPHITGIIVGMLLILAGVSAGLGALFVSWPMIHEILRGLGAIFLFYLAWRIATSGGDLNKETKPAKPLSLIEATVFQFVNPKAWLINISAISTFSIPGTDYWNSAFIIALVFSLVMLNTLPLWTSCGMLIRRWLLTPESLQRFNWLMGLVTAASVILILK